MSDNVSMPGDEHPDRSDQSEAERLFDSFAERLENPEVSIDFEEWVAGHPDHKDRLRVMYDEWENFQSFASRVRDRFGILDEGSASASGDSSAAEQLQRLKDRSVPVSDQFQLRGELGRGGMGVVLRVWDQEIQRDLAMKVLHPRKGGSRPSRMQARFLAEAQITGQLEHPGVIPVHQIGVNDEGEAFFTMAMVKGQDLSKIFGLAREHRDGWSTTRAVGVLLKVCETLAYAHSKKVIHRDLKPSNVMVGRFGEVYVMDWGLAKSARPGAETIASGASAILTVRDQNEEGSPSPWATQDGAVLGTPAYMSPEQASGNPADLGPRSDLYSVGAMLYQLLSGSAPYTSGSDDRSPVAILQRLQRGAPPSLRDIAPEVPPELQAITDKAMARLPEDRYSDMLSMADDLRAYLENRVVRTYETGAFAEARKWVQRNRSVAGWVAAAAVVAVASLLALVAVQLKSNEELSVRARELQVAESNAQDEANSLAEVVHLMEEIFNLPAPDRARGRTITAREMVDRAAVHLANPQQDIGVNARLSKMVGQLYLTLGFEREALRVIEKALETVAKELEPDSPQTLQLRSVRAVTWGYIGRFDEAVEEYAAIEGPLMASDAFTARQKVDFMVDRAALDIRRHANEEAEQGFLRALEHAEREFGAESTDVLTIRNNLGVIYQRWLRLEEAEEIFKQVYEGRVLIDGPDDPLTATAQANLAAVVLGLGRNEEARDLYQQALELRRKVLPEGHPDILWTMRSLASAYEILGEGEQALALSQEAYETAERRLLPNDPMRLSLRQSLGSALLATGDIQGAREIFEEDVRVRREVSSPDDPGLVQGLVRLSNIHRMQGGYAAAEPLLKEALAIQRRRGAQELGPFVDLLLRMGILYRFMGELGKSEIYLEEAYDTARERGGVEHPISVRAALQVALLRQSQGDEDAAGHILEEQLALTEEHLPSEHGLRSATLFQYAQLLEKWDMTDEAIELVTELVETAAPSNSQLADYRALLQRLQDA